MSINNANQEIKQDVKISSKNERFFSISHKQCSRELFEELDHRYLNLFLGDKFTYKTTNCIKINKRASERKIKVIYIRFSPTSSRMKPVAITSSPDNQTGKISVCSGYLCKTVLDAESVISYEKSKNTQNIIIFDKCGLLESSTEAITLCIYIKRLMRNKNIIIATCDEKTELGEDITIFRRMIKDERVKIFKSFTKVSELNTEVNED